LFRSAVRRVLEYIDWITIEPVVEEMTDDVIINVRMALQRIKEKKLLTLKVFKCMQNLHYIEFIYLYLHYIGMKEIRILQYNY